MSITEDRSKAHVEDDQIEIRLSDIVYFLKASRRRATLCGLTGLIIGVLYAVTKPNIYTSQVTVMPEIQARSSGIGGLGSLAGLAGIDITSGQGAGVDAIRPDIYPDVLESAPFALHLLKQTVYSELLQRETSLQTFLDEQGKESLFNRLFNSSDKEKDKQSAPAVKQSKVLYLTDKQEGAVKFVHNAVSTSYDKKTGIITVTASLTDPAVVADVARLSLDYLTNYITSYRTEKARNQVDFLTRQVNEAKRKYESTELAVSVYRDRNRGLFLNTAKIEEQRLQGDFLLAQSVYNDLSKQLEQAKLKVAEESPVFKTLEPPTVPLRKSGPNRTLIVIGSIMVGIITGVISYGINQLRLYSKK